MEFLIHLDKNLTAAEVAELLVAVGCNEDHSCPLDGVERHLAGSTFIAHARDLEGRLLGYASALSDLVYSTYVSGVAVRPGTHRRGIGRALVEAIEKASAGVPIFGLSADDHGLQLRQA